MDKGQRGKQETASPVNIRLRQCTVTSQYKAGAEADRESNRASGVLIQDYRGRATGDRRTANSLPIAK